MVTFHLNGQITEDGEIRIDVPEGVQLPPGEVRVTLQLVTDAAPEVSDETLWTDEELAELLKIEPKSGAEALAELEKLDSIYGNPWTEKGITDSVEWVLEQRRKNRRQYPRW
jgi:hypothetical protein